MSRDVKDISIIVIHCSDSDRPEHDDISIIKQWHLERGFKDVGYHYYIKQNGKIQIGRSIFVTGAHVQGFNSESIGICLGGSKKFTDSQMRSAAKLIDTLHAALPSLKPKYGILPHRFLDPKKTCPNFELKEIFKYCKAALMVDDLGRYA
jgi:N-acetylmuramoyl-L-alanine amidase